MDQEHVEQLNLSNRANIRGFKSAARKPPVPMAHGSSKPLLSQGGSPTVEPAGTNFGERLYRRGLKKREELENRLRNARSEQLRAETDGFTF